MVNWHPLATIWHPEGAGIGFCSVKNLSFSFGPWLKIRLKRVLGKKLKRRQGASAEQQQAFWVSETGDEQLLSQWQFHAVSSFNM